MKNWYYTENGERLGPVEEKDLAEKLRSEQLARGTLVWKKGMGEWSPAIEVPAFGFLEELPPPPPSTPDQDEPPPPPQVSPPPIETPPPPLASSPSQTDMASERAKYPKWTWICLGVSVFLMLCCGVWVVDVEDRAAPYISELDYMDSGEYALGTALESFIRGYAGDPYGTAYDVERKYSNIMNELSELNEEYDAANTWAGIFFFSSIAFLVLGIVKHKQFRA